MWFYFLFVFFCLVFCFCWLGCGFCFGFVVIVVVQGFLLVCFSNLVSLSCKFSKTDFFFLCVFVDIQYISAPISFEVS